MAVRLKMTAAAVEEAQASSISVALSLWPSKRAAIAMFQRATMEESTRRVIKRGFLAQTVSTTFPRSM